MSPRTNYDVLKNSVKTRFGKPLNSVKSFEELAIEVKVSSQTLRRFFGKIDKDKAVSYTTLSQIAKYVGFRDWDDFLETSQAGKIDEKDRILIDGMSPFFINGEKYNLDYEQNTLAADTLNDYARIIYKNRENVEYFYKKYYKNNWATDYILAWLPNYSYFGQNWFRAILKDKAKRTKVSHVRLSQSNFLVFGSWLTGDTVEFFQDVNQVRDFYKTYQNDFPYMPYHEMRFCTIQMIDAKRKNDEESLFKVLHEYLINLKKQNFTKLHQQEMIIFLANTLLWLQEYEAAASLLNEVKSFIEEFPASLNIDNPFHYFGINMAFVKTTFAMASIAANEKNTEEFELTKREFSDPTGILYNSYIRVMYLAKCILAENGITHKRKIFSELKTLVNETRYFRIYSVLEDLDPLFSKYVQ